MLFSDEYAAKIEDAVFREALELQASGQKIIGLYCAFTPKELVLAAGAVPVALCAGTEKPMEAAERHLPRNLCPLIRSSYGHALIGTCPYFDAADFILADATCDGKKKMFELLKRIKPLHTLQLPQTSETAAARSAWTEELRTVRGILETVAETRITDASLARTIRLYNRYRQAKKEIFDLNLNPVPLLNGREIDRIVGASPVECNLEQRIGELSKARRLARQRASDKAFMAKMSTRPRILLTGCPTANKKVLEIIENSGAVVVAMENCGGLKTLGMPVLETDDPIEALADRYLNTACSCMTPNTRRLDILGDLIESYRIDGVVELTWEYCHTYNIEATLVKEWVVDRYRTPYIQIRTDYSENDTEQLRTRIEAFLETLDGRGNRAAG